MLNPDGFLTLDKRVSLKPYVARAPKQYQLMTDAEIINGKGGTLIVDTESYFNYFLIAFKDTKTDKIITLEVPFDNRKLSWIMHSYRTVGFNSNNYDIPIIWLSYYQQDTTIIQQMSQDIVFRDIRKSELVNEYKFIIHPTNHIDLIEVCPLKGSLKLYGARIHSPRIQDLPFDVNNDLTENQIPIVKDYCINDLDETHRLFDFLKERLDLRQNMSIEYKEDLMSKSDAQIAEKIISKEVQKLTGKYPRRPIIKPYTPYNYIVPSFIDFKLPILRQMLEYIKIAKFTVNQFGSIDMPKEMLNANIHINNAVYRMGIGGLHSFEKNVSYRSVDNLSIIDRDVASYYPNIILNLGLYPQHMGPSFLEVYKGIVQRRLEAKRTGNTTADTGLKVVINGSFGKFGSMWSTLYSPDLMIQVTITGQLALLMLIEMLENYGIQVISANTDGVVMICPQELEATYKQVIVMWERATGFTTEETRYRAYYARDVNAYFAVKLDGNVKVKGPYSEIGSTTRTQLDNNPASLICSDAVKALLSKQIPIEKTILECKDIKRFVTVRNVKGGAHKNGNYLGKVIRWYYSNDIVGTINYISNNNKVPDTDNAKPCMDLPDIFPSDISYDWYISKTNEILEEINYLPKKKQLTFF